MQVHSLLALFFLQLVASFSLNQAVFGKGQPPVTDKEPIPGDSPLQHCDLSLDQIITIKKVDLSPNPPARGKELVISASGLIKKTVEQGSYVNVEVRLGYIKLLTQTFDLCEMLTENSIEGIGECPISPGAYDNLSKTVKIPDEVPPGKYTILARAYNAKEELITCITGDIVFPAAF